MKPIKIPKFENESDEADWMYEHREELAAEIVSRLNAREGEAGFRLEARLRDTLQTNELVVSPAELKERSLVSVLRHKLGSR